MCGLVAMVTKGKYGFQYKDKAMFEQMLYADALRGEDSTGVFSVNKYGNLKMLKSAKTSADFIRTKGFQDFSDKIFAESRMVVGHNRASTRGATIEENAHPFIEDHICLVHNGTLHTHKELADTTVDSHAIATAIAKEGYQAVLPKINGAFALIWYDAKLKKMFVARNKDRPLWVLQTKEADYIASEPDMLQWIYKRVYGKVGEAKFFSVDLVYSWDVDDPEVGYDTEKMPAKKVSLVPYQAKPLPALTPVARILSGVGNSSSQTLHGCTEYTRGQQIVFEHVSNSIVGDMCTFHGITRDSNEAVVQGACNIAGKTRDELEDLLDGSDYLTGEYVGYSKPNGKLKIFLLNVKAVKEYTTCNGHLLTLQQIADAGHCCHECGTIIEPEDDDNLFWARVKGNDVKRMLCPTCVGLHPKLHELLKEQDTCTQSESPSLDINLDQDQYVYSENDWINY